MPRKRRPLDRDGGTVDRDASLIIIASEDRYAVQQYFARFKAQRVQILVLATEDCRSAPQHVIQRLNDFVAQHVTEPGDTFWLCIDRDRWPQEALAPILSESHRKGYSVAISSPCFELWILLHFEAASPEMESCEHVSARLRDLLGGYAKQCCRKIDITGEMVHRAVERARSLGEVNHADPKALATEVYKILDMLIQRDKIVFA